MKDEDLRTPVDLKVRTTEFALRIIRLYSAGCHWWLVHQCCSIEKPVDTDGQAASGTIVTKA
jgi:hypothetical protein